MKNLLFIFTLLLSFSTIDAQQKSIKNGPIKSSDKKATSTTEEELLMDRARDLGEDLISNPSNNQAVKRLVDKEKIAFKTNNNNGRSNKDKCCGTITASSGNSMVVFNSQSKWYMVNGSQQNLVANPIAILSQVKNEWEVELRTNDGAYVSQKILGSQNGTMLLSIGEVANGRYYIELNNSGDIYRTAFSKGTSRPTVSKNKSSRRN